jgi:hypothetical protein
MSCWKAVLLLRQLVHDVSRQRFGFDPRSVYVGFMVDNMAIGQVFLPVLQFSPVSIIPPMFHTHFCQRFPLTSRTNWQSLGTLNSKALLFIGEHWTGEYFHFFQARKCHMSVPLLTTIAPGCLPTSGGGGVVHEFSCLVYTKTEAATICTVWCCYLHVTVRTAEQTQHTSHCLLLLPSLAPTHNY